MAQPQVDLSSYDFTPRCACGKPADVLAKGCRDGESQPMCDPCLTRGLDVISKWVHLYQKHNHRVAICGDCHRPILTLETHLEIKRL